MTSIGPSPLDGIVFSANRIAPSLPRDNDDKVRRIFSGKKERTGGGSRFRLPAGRYAEAPAAALVPPLAWREFPKSRLRRRYADFSDTLQLSVWNPPGGAGCPTIISLRVSSTIRRRMIRHRARYLRKKISLIRFLADAERAQLVQKVLRNLELPGRSPAHGILHHRLAQHST